VISLIRSGIQNQNSIVSVERGKENTASLHNLWLAFERDLKEGIKGQWTRRSWIIH